MKIKLKKASVMFSVSVAIILLMVLFTFFAIIVFKNNVNLVLYDLKNDLCLISRNSIFSIEKNLMGEDVEEIDEYSLRSCISDEIREAWNLDRGLNNGTGLIKSADIVELTVLEAGDRDKLNNKKVDCLTVHLVIRVSVKPIILNNIFENKFYFNLHEDLKINKLEM